MGANAIIYLPHNARVTDVANVIGLLSGLPLTRRSDNGWTYVTVPGVDVNATTILGLAEIIIKGNLIDGQTMHHVFFHYEDTTHAEYSKILMPSSTPYWLAVGKGLIEFFGGKLVFNDCLSEEGIVSPKPRPHYDQENNDQYEAFKKELFGVRALTTFDLLQMRQYAAYLDA